MSKREPVSLATWLRRYLLTISIVAVFMLMLAGYCHYQDLLLTYD